MDRNLRFVPKQYVLYRGAVCVGQFSSTLKPVPSYNTKRNRGEAPAYQGAQMSNELEWQTQGRYDGPPGVYAGVQI